MIHSEQTLTAYKKSSRLLPLRHPLVVLTATLMLSAAASTQAATYYLDGDDGNDRNDGTSTAPWKTLRRAMIDYDGPGTKVTYGDTVLLRNGHYGEFTLSNSNFPTYGGSSVEPLPESQKWVTYKAEPDQKEVYFSKIWLSLGQDLRVVAHVFDGIKIVDPGGRCVLAQAVTGLRLRNMTLIGELDPAALEKGTTYYCATEFKKPNNDIRIDRCEIQGGYRGVSLGAHNNNFQITNCDIHKTGVDKIFSSGCTNILIEGNRLHGPALLPAEHPDCIQFYTAANRYEGASATNVTIRGNRLYNHSSQGIWTGGSILKNVIFENNLIYTTGNYEWRVYGVHGGIIRNNTIVGDDVGHTGIIIYGGTFTESDGTLNGYPRNQDITVVNNVFATSYSGAPSVMTYHDHNIYVRPWDGSPGENEPHSYGFDSIEAAVAALFVNPEAHDYRLKDGSYAIDFGTTEAEIYPTDIDGNPRGSPPDAGCFESGFSPADRAPSLDPIGNQRLTVDVPFTLEVTATDPEGDSLTYSASSLPDGAVFSGQTFSWTPTSSQLGAHQVTFEVSDGSSYDSETVTFTVETYNSAPVLSDIGNKSTDENEPLSFSISATDADGDTLSYSVDHLPNGASFTGQTFTWTPDYDQAGSYDVTFVASDGRDSDSETVTISVANINRPPVLTSVGDQSVDESASLTLTLSAHDPDGDSLAYSATDLPSGATLNGQDFNWTPTSNQIGSHDITFVVSDGDLQASERITVFVVAIDPDGTAPVVARAVPAKDAIQVPLNNLVTLHVTDAGKGVDPDSVLIEVNGAVVYEGDTEVYTSADGRCSRSGTTHDYKFIYQPNEMFDFDHTVTITVSAADLAVNVMSAHTYSFVTEMRTFGSNYLVSEAPGGQSKSSAATVSDLAGNIWVVWQAGEPGAGDIYVARKDPRASEFAAPTRLTTNEHDQCRPDMARGSEGQLYIVWQDNRRGNWDVFASISSDGVNWSRPVQITDSNDNEVNPVVAIDGQSPNCAYIAWQDDRNGNEDIYVASSARAFVDPTVWRLTTDDADQTDPDMAVDVSDTVYVVWTDARNGQTDIYGAASDSGSWTTVPFVTGTSTQSDPAVVAVPGDSTLHLLWVDDAPGDTDILHAWSAGLPSSPITGSTIIDDTSGANQSAPAIACADSLKVFACWQDDRHVGAYGSDSDLFLTELGTGAARTNVLVGDDGTSANQRDPALGVDDYGNPYIVWTDDRGGMSDIYYAATTIIDPNPLDSKLVVASVGATVGCDPATIDEPEDVSIIVPANACQADVRMTIAKILNPQALPTECLGGYDFGPSGVEFDQPVTVTIPYHFAQAGSSALPYWYDSLTGTLSQHGITDIENILISDDLNALRFKTTHFTPFYVVASDTGTSSSDGGGGGCSVSATGGGSPGEMILPYMIVAVMMVILRRRDRKKRESMRTTEG